MSIYVICVQHIYTHIQNICKPWCQSCVLPPPSGCSIGAMPLHLCHTGQVNSDVRTDLLRSGTSSSLTQARPVSDFWKCLPPEGKHRHRKKSFESKISENTSPQQGSIDTSKRSLKNPISENTCPRQGSIDTSKRTLKIQISENTCPRQGSTDT